MKKLFSMICIFVLLCSLVMPCFATEVNFYADPKDSGVLQAIEKNDDSIRAELSYAAKYYFNPYKENNLDKAKFEYDFEHIYEWKYISTSQTRELLKAKDVLTFIDDLSTTFYYVPVFYDRQLNPEPRAVIWFETQESHTEYKWHDEAWSAKHAAGIITNQELSMQKINEVAGDGYTLLFNFCDNIGLYFSLVEKEGRRYLINMGGTPMSRYFDEMPQKYKDMLNTPVWTIEQADEFFAKFQHIEETTELPTMDEILYTGVGSVEENQPQYPWLYWIIGGAVVVIGGLVTVILVKKKKE